MRQEGKPNRKPNRWSKWNYSDFGFYFVTVCVKDREEYFGAVKEEVMELNEFGNVAHQYWKEVENHFDDVGIDEFVVMPNHVHGIILITGDEAGNVCGNRIVENVSRGVLAGNTNGNHLVGNRTGNCLVGNALPDVLVGNRHACSLQVTRENMRVLLGNGRQYQKLPVIIGSFKSAVTRFINSTQSKFHFCWQKSFCDHIIHTPGELERIRKYIRDNPANWNNDRNNAENLYY